MLGSSTPDALWSAPSLRLLRPAAVSCTGLRRVPFLDRCTLSVPVGTRLLVVSEPDESGSVLLKVLAGLARPERGSVEIAGLSDPSRDGWARRVAYLGSDAGIRPWMTPREALRLAADLLGIPAGSVDERVDRVVAWTRIPPSAVDEPVSRGGPALIQRTGLAAGLLADPEVLLFDEPLRALEATERAELLRLPGRRRTMLLASRYPASEAGLVSHVALLRGGRVRLLVRVEELEAAGLPLSMRGIAALADLRGPGGGGPPPRRRPAQAAR